MGDHRILLKLAAPADNAPTLRAGGASLDLTPLFTPSPARETRSRRTGVAPEPAATWYRARPVGGQAFGASSSNAWDVAHAVIREGVDGAEVLAAEPDLPQDWLPRPDQPLDLTEVVSNPCEAPEPQNARFGRGEGFGWHLDDAHSGLRAARDRVGAASRAVTVVHLDTGYDAEHEALPVNLDRERQRNFVDGDGLRNDASDRTPAAGFLKHRGHGTGTLGILAGGDTRGLRAAAEPGNVGPLGGAPNVRVVPVRIADSVVHFRTSAVAQGIDCARRIGADVVSMSMGGLPSAAWADAVNAAYEAGVVLVCAAGNSFAGLPTSLIVYPARFNRVIAACGVMAGDRPYYGLGGPMEGCAGPVSKMRTALAAYTPNIPWLRLGCRTFVDMDGAGTSAATPQIAAAAALWLAENGARFPDRDWRRVEAVRAALFGSARKARGARAGEPHPLLGMGVLQAAKALDLVPEADALKPEEPDSASFALLRLLTSVFGVNPADERRRQMFQLELAQLALNSRGFREAVPEPADAGRTLSEAAIRRGLTAILDERTASLALREHLGDALGRPMGRQEARAVLPGVPGPRATPAGQAVAAKNRLARTGRDLTRQPAIPMPTRRRLRIYATDPGDSGQLETSFVNLATVEVAWEPLQPGPVGEYLEVVDVDPASNAAYPPVDLDDPRLLAQDGYAPSEGNPQFHHQMVYAVAMRTIRNFEIALGRPALWAPRSLSKTGERFVPPPDGGYVQRLRIYPHALRGRNAYYSADKKALLFGYFDHRPPGPSAPKAGPGSTPMRPQPDATYRTVFTCLSHDIVAHETTHALLDGLHRRFKEATNPDVLAFHEAFADIVAIFQHFTFPELLRYEIGRLRGDLSQESMLSDLARQFGRSLHNQRALRRALAPRDRRRGDDPEDPGPPLLDYRQARESHERGAILVAAVFEAFVAIYTRRTQDLFRIASGGTGVLRPGALHPDLVERLAREAVATAQRVLTTAIRALDYMPPVSPTFGDYLRAIVTADADLAPDRGFGYRVAFAEAFARRCIQPEDIRSVSPDALLWQAPAGPVQSDKMNEFIRTLDLGAYQQSDRRRAYDSAKRSAAQLHDWLAANLDIDMARALGLVFGPTMPDGRPTPRDLLRKDGRPIFEVHSVRTARRTTDEGEPRTDVVAVITQKCKALYDPSGPENGPYFYLRGGCTLLLDRGFRSDPIRFAVYRPIWNEEREERERSFLTGADGSSGSNALYGGPGEGAEPFAALHAGFGGE